MEIMQRHWRRLIKPLLSCGIRYCLSTVLHEVKTSQEKKEKKMKEREKNDINARTDI